MALAALGIAGLAALMALTFRKRVGPERSQPKRKRGSRGKALSGVRAEVASALRNQGYRAADAKRAARSAQGNGFETLFRDALKRLR